MSIERIELRPTVMTVDLPALGRNFKAVNKLVGDSQVMAVVKANAYGHGLVPCSQHLVESGANWIGVAFVEEGIELRKAGLRVPILVFGGIFDSQIKHFIDYDLDLTASSIDKLEGIEETASWSGKKARVHLKIDTGMERIGVHHYNAEKFISSALALRNIEVVGVFSHFATAGEDREFAAVQLERFNHCVEFTKQECDRLGIAKPMFHLANSTGAISIPEARFDMVRCGIALYGVYPSAFLRELVQLEPVMKLSSRIVYFKVTKAGAGVGYGQTWRAEKDTRIVTVPIGCLLYTSDAADE